MKKELTLLEQKVEQLILNNARLRAENHHLRQQLALRLNGQEIEPLDAPNDQPTQPTEQTP
jgi:regulator of replication initiation timing